MAVQYRSLFTEFIRRFKDKQVSIRLSMLQWAQTFLLVMAGDGVFAAVEDAVHALLLDFDETVRIAACGVLCDVAAAKPAAVPQEHLQVHVSRVFSRSIVWDALGCAVLSIASHSPPRPFVYRRATASLTAAHTRPYGSCPWFQLSAKYALNSAFLTGDVLHRTLLRTPYPLPTTHHTPITCLVNPRRRLRVDRQKEAGCTATAQPNRTEPFLREHPRAASKPQRSPRVPSISSPWPRALPPPPQDVAQRLRDKKVAVRRAALRQLARVHRSRLASHHPPGARDTALSWIPAKLLRCCPDADMRHHAVEAVIEEQLFPPKLSSQVRGLPSHLLS